ncbi:MAG: STAS domain-containing protein [Okeania sp. SIO3H1]|uniref:STAS domain-containing protein n=1 Tax=Okeania sp. SIO1I7 TaxID=2607772 RepID=UPI0013CB7D51|nr:STAS domain-containing protein [Okeania sp. SIO1I7]NEN89069.1 STAS domain-containing protein [Okeania sp. SIO3H1]NET28711.1 STAS domain-containing protein [Okeania sp. SIO1I7]
MKAILFRPQGNLDFKRSHQLKQIVDKLIDKTRNFYCIIDMGLVNKINNFGLTTLVIIRKISEKRGCLLYLFNIQDDIQLVFQLTGLDKEFHFLEDKSFLYSLKPQLLLC